MGPLVASAYSCVRINYAQLDKDSANSANENKIDHAFTKTICYEEDLSQGSKEEYLKFPRSQSTAAGFYECIS